MSARPVVALWVVGWVVVAVAGATLAWSVISRAGGGVSGGLEAVSEPTGDARSPSDTVTGTTLSPSPTTDSSSPSGGGTGAGADSVSLTWEGDAGVVTVTCRGPSIVLDSAVAYSGYGMERDDAGPDRVRVEFESDESDLRVEAECVDGEPVFSDDRSGEG